MPRFKIKQRQIFCYKSTYLLFSIVTLGQRRCPICLSYMALQNEYCIYNNAPAGIDISTFNENNNQYVLIANKKQEDNCV